MMFILLSLLDFWFVVFPLTCALIAMTFWYWFTGDTSNLPPGPPGLPVVGYIPFLYRSFSHYDLFKLSKKYGSIYRLKLGPDNVVIVNNLADAKQALEDEAFQDRPEPNWFDAYTRGKGGVLSWSGRIWKNHRTFTIRALQNLMADRGHFENLVQDEISYLIEQIEKSSQDFNPVAIGDLLTGSTCNVAHCIAFGKRFNPDHLIRQLMKKIFFDTRSSPFPLTSYLIHFLKLFEWTNEKNLPLPNSLATIMANVDNLRRYILQEVKVHHEHFKPTDEKDYLDMYIGACKNKESPQFNARHSYGLIQQLLDASSSTMKDCLEWTFVYLAKYDVHQNDLVQEVSNVIGFDRKPAFADREKLVYLEAFLNEVLRKSSVLPLNLQHCASKETKLGSYTIPEGFQLIVNLWALHHDPTVWKEPETFDPKRFWQSEEGETIVNQSFLPFSYGSRSCPGEQLARTVMVTLIASVIQKFRVVEAPEIELKEEGRICGFSHVPSDSRVIFEPRGH